MDLVAVKIFVLLLLFAVALAFGFLPVTVLRRVDPTSKRTRFILSSLNCFSAGILMGTAFLHLLPNVKRTVQQTVDELGIAVNYPFAELAASLGLILIMTIEQVVGMCQERSRRTAKGTEEGFQLIKGGKSRNSDSGDDMFSDDDGEAHHAHFASDLADDKNVMRFFVLFFAISSHTVFEGVAIGLQKNIVSVWALLLAISVHKAVLSFTLGLEIFQSGMRLRNIVALMVLFAFIAPVGITVGIVTINCASSVVSNLANGVLTGVATGTFFYVTFVEILARELRAHPGFFAVSCVVVGFGITAVLAVFS